MPKSLKTSKMFLGFRYQGRLIYRSTDEWGDLEIIETRTERSLHFGGVEKQSACLLADAEHLLLDYTQAMALSGFLVEDPQHILVMGLGGGSLVKYFLARYPQAQILVVELRPKVVELAERYFGLAPNARVHYWVGDARDFLKERHSTLFDLIIVDLFDQEGMSFAARQHGFLPQVSKIASPRGVVAMNLWDHPQSLFNAVRDQALKSFARVLQLPVDRRTNVILFGLMRELGLAPKQRWLAQAQELDQAQGTLIEQHLIQLIQENGIL